MISMVEMGDSNPRPLTENRRLKRIVADLTLNVDALKIVAQGKF